MTYWSDEVKIIENEISVAEEGIARLIRHLETLKRRRNELLPIASLPPELLEMIFLFAIEDDPPDAVYPAALMTILRVCHQWSSIARACPILWTTVKFTYNRSFVAFCLESSRQLSLTVFGTFQEETRGNLQLTMLESYRITTLELTFLNAIDEDSCMRTIRAYNLPELRIFFLRAPPALLQVMTNGLAALNCPELRDLNIQGVHLTYFQSWEFPRLEALAIRDVDERDIMHHLPLVEVGCPALTSLTLPRLGATTLHGHLQPASPLRLQSLAKLILSGKPPNMDKFVRYVALSAPGRLSVECRSSLRRFLNDDSATMFDALRTYLAGCPGANMTVILRIKDLDYYYITMLAMVHDTTAASPPPTLFFAVEKGIGTADVLDRETAIAVLQRFWSCCPMQRLRSASLMVFNAHGHEPAASVKYVPQTDVEPDRAVAFGALVGKLDERRWRHQQM